MALQAPALIYPSTRYDRFRQMEIFIENWLDFLTARTWTLSGTASSTAVPQVATAGNQGGNLLLSPPDATINNELYLFLTTSRFIYADGATFSLKEKVKFTQAATNQAAVHVGFMSAPGTNTIVATTGVPKASFSGAIFYTKAGDINWWVGCSVGTGFITTRTNIVAGGALAQNLRIDIKCKAGVAEVQYFVDENPCLDESTAWSQPIKHSLTYSGAVAMTGFIGVRQCSAVAQPVTHQGYGHGIAHGSW